MTALQFSGDILTKRPSLVMPALLTSTSIGPPAAASAAWTIAWQEA
jgi:hypothetical protein